MNSNVVIIALAAALLYFFCLSLYQYHKIHHYEDILREYQEAIKALIDEFNKLVGKNDGCME